MNFPIIIIRVSPLFRFRFRMIPTPYGDFNGLICFFLFFYLQDTLACFLCTEQIKKKGGGVSSSLILMSAAAPVAERLRAPSLNHSFISPLCLVWVRTPLWPHVRQAKFCLRMCQVVFLLFSPHLLIGPSHMS